MESYDYQKYLAELASCSGTAYLYKAYDASGSMGVEIKITSLAGGNISPSLPVGNTKFSFTTYNPDRRIMGVDNHERKPLHLHCSGTFSPLPEINTLSLAGSVIFALMPSGTIPINR